MQTLGIWLLGFVLVGHLGRTLDVLAAVLLCDVWAKPRHGDGKFRYQAKSKSSKTTLKVQHIQTLCKERKGCFISHKTGKSSILRNWQHKIASLFLLNLLTKHWFYLAWKDLGQSCKLPVLLCRSLPLPNTYPVQKMWQPNSSSSRPDQEVIQITENMVHRKISFFPSHRAAFTQDLWNYKEYLAVFPLLL